MSEQHCPLASLHANIPQLLGWETASKCGDLEFLHTPTHSAPDPEGHGVSRKARRLCGRDRHLTQWLQSHSLGQDHPRGASVTLSRLSPFFGVSDSYSKVKPRNLPFSQLLRWGVFANQSPHFVSQALCSVPHNWARLHTPCVTEQEEGLREAKWPRPSRSKPVINPECLIKGHGHLPCPVCRNQRGRSPALCWLRSLPSRVRAYRLFHWPPLSEHLQVCLRSYAISRRTEGRAGHVSSRSLSGSWVFLRTLIKCGFALASEIPCRQKP